MSQLSRKELKILVVQHRLTMDTLAANAFIFMLAGYETTNTALCFATWLLAKHTDVQQKLREEVEQQVTRGFCHIFPTPGTTCWILLQTELSFDTVRKLPYLDAVFHEALRIYPPVV